MRPTTSDPRPRSRGALLHALVAIAAAAAAIPAARAGTATASTAPVAAQEAPSACVVPPTAGPDPRRPRYQVHVDVRPAERRVDGDLRVTFTPDLDTERLVFRLWANRPAPERPEAPLAVSDVRLGGQPAAVTRPDPTTLVVAVPGGLTAGTAIDASLSWSLSLRGWQKDRISLTGSGATAAVRLGSFFPILAWEPGVGWDLTPPIRTRYETSMSPTADFVTTVAVPGGLGVLASGVPGPGNVFTATAVRDVGISVGRFTTVAGTAHAPDPVSVVVGVAAGLAENPSAYLRRAIGALEIHSRRFGPYPWTTYSLALTPDLKGGIEYPTHVMQGPASLGRTTPHEVAHQWFYSLVGNDQGRDPWLDEGLASWAEFRAEGTLGVMRARSVPVAGVDRVGESMAYWDSHESAYYRGVYVQTAQALAALGPADEVDCALRIYVARNAYRVARPEDLAAAVAAVVPTGRAVLDRYGALSGPG